MVDRPAASPTVYTFGQTVLTPAGTPVTAPLVTPVAIGDAWLESVRLRVPPGPSGALGVRLVYNGANLIPWAQGASYLVLDDHLERYEVLTEIDQHLTVVSYNNGFWDHSSYWLFSYIPMTALDKAVPNFIDLGA